MAKNNIDLSIVTLDGTALHMQANEVVLNTESGEITLLPNHAPLISVIKPGNLMIVTVDGERKNYHSEQGFLEVRDESRVIILSDQIKSLN